VRVRVKFRYRADTGEVEAFEVDDLQSGPPLADHDARHERAAADVARIVENNALIVEVAGDVELRDAAPVRATGEPVQATGEQPERRRERSTDG
jgi:FtsH ternary system domain X3